MKLLERGVRKGKDREINASKKGDVGDTCAPVLDHASIRSNMGLSSILFEIDLIVFSPPED